MRTIPRAADFLPQKAARGAFVRKPIPPIVPDAPLSPDWDSMEQSFMIIKGLHHNRPVAVSVDDNGRLLIGSILHRVLPVPTAAPVIYPLPGSGPVNVAVTPGAGGAMTVAFQIAEGGAWRPWPKGSVSADTVDRLEGQVFALRFTATTAAGTAEVAQ